MNMTSLKKAKELLSPKTIVYPQDGQNFQKFLTKAIATFTEPSMFKIRIGMK